MRLIDSYAHSTRIRTVDPSHKVMVVIVVAGLCLALDKPAVGVLAAIGMWTLASSRAGIPCRVFAGLMAAEIGFLSMAAAGVAVSIGSAAGEGVWGFVAGPLWIGGNRASLELAARVVARTLGCAAAMNYLALTTPVVDLLDLMRRLRLPPMLVDLVAMVYRFVFALLESLARMRLAQESRLGYASLRRGMASAGLLAGGLFVDGYRRALRLQIGLESRGYAGELRLLPSRYRSDPGLYFAAATLVGAMLVVWSLT